MSNRQDRKQRRDSRPGSKPAPAAQGVADSAEAQIETRSELIRKLREARGVDAVVVYVTSSRPGIPASMTLDAVRRILDHMPDERVPKLDLFIHSDGGDSIVPWRLMTLLREYADTVDVLVPHRAFSAATLAALGANRIVMAPLGMLGPIDPTVHDSFGPLDPETGQRPGVSVEDVAEFTALVEEDLKIRGDAEKLQAFALLARKVHPLTLGRVRRGSSQARMLGRKLLQLRDPEAKGEDLDRLVGALTKELYFHGHPINRREALDLDLHVDIPSAAVEAAMWDLYVAYEDLMELEQPFDAIAEAAQRITGPVPTPGQPGPKVAKIEGIPRVIVESEAGCDVFELDLEITLGRNAEGHLEANMVTTRAEWTEQEPTDA